MDEYRRQPSEDLLDELRERDTYLIRMEEAYDVDNCKCPPCGCLKKVWLLPVSPAGIGAAGGILLGTSPL